MSQFLFYISNGALSALIYFSLLNLLISFSLSLIVSISLSFFFSTIFNFIFNKYLTFKSYKNIYPEIAHYSLMIFFSYLLTIFLTNYFIIFFSFSVNVSSLLTIGICTVFRFFYSKFFVFCCESPK